MAAMGVDETVSARIHVEASGQGPEAAAREARYSVLEEVAERFGSHVVLLGHTLDDQAETVLLGLTRGSGGRSIAGMRPAFDRFRRPLLDITRAQTVAACAAEGLDVWTDPHNADPRLHPVPDPHGVMPMLERELGPGVAGALARTASQIQADVGALDALAEKTYDDLATDRGLLVAELENFPDAVRLRVIRLAALAAGATPGDLTQGALLGVDELVWNWRGQQWVDLPGKVRATRQDGWVAFNSSVSPA